MGWTLWATLIHERTVRVISFSTQPKWAYEQASQQWKDSVRSSKCSSKVESYSQGGLNRESERMETSVRLCVTT